LPFRHEALLYDGADKLLDAVRPFLSTDEPVLIAARADSPLSALDGFTELPRNPARIIPLWRDFVDAHDGPVRGIGEPIWAGRGGAEIVECQLHESLLGDAFDDDFSLLCPYDTATLDEAVILEAERSHPRRDTAFPLAPLPPPPSGAHLLGFDLASLHEVREFVTHHGGWPDFVLAIDELAANSIRHGGGRGIVRIWRDHGSLVCEVRDQGRITNPLAGRLRPDDDADGGRGLWIANQVCDLVQIRPGAVRVRGSLSRP
jgi:hypothetical protein